MLTKEHLQLLWESTWLSVLTISAQVWYLSSQGAEFSFPELCCSRFGSITGPNVAGITSLGLQPFSSCSKWTVRLPKHPDFPRWFSPGVKDKTDPVILCFFPPAPSTLVAIVLFFTTAMLS